MKHGSAFRRQADDRLGDEVDRLAIELPVEIGRRSHPHAAADERRDEIVAVVRAGATVARDERRPIDPRRQSAAPGLAHERLGGDLRLRVPEMHAAHAGQRIERLVHAARSERRVADREARDEMERNRSGAGQPQQLARAGDVRRAKAGISVDPVHRGAAVDDGVHVSREILELRSRQAGKRLSEIAVHQVNASVRRTGDSRARGVRIADQAHDAGAGAAQELSEQCTSEKSRGSSEQDAPRPTQIGGSRRMRRPHVVRQNAVGEQLIEWILPDRPGRAQGRDAHGKGSRVRAVEQQIGRQPAAERLFERRRHLDRRERVDAHERERSVGIEARRRAQAPRGDRRNRRFDLRPGDRLVHDATRSAVSSSVQLASG